MCRLQGLCGRFSKWCIACGMVGVGLDALIGDCWFLVLAKGVQFTEARDAIHFLFCPPASLTLHTSSTALPATSYCKAVTSQCNAGNWALSEFRREWTSSQLFCSSVL
jgi:hypothetical protein